MSRVWLSFVVLAAFACGDDDGVARDGGTSDGGAFDGATDSAVDASRDAEPPVSDDGGEDAGDAGTDAGAVDRYDEVLAAFETESSASALDALLTDVGHVEGWPLVSGERWLFATRWDAVTGVAWVGDPNAWNPAANPARSAPSGVHYFVEIVGIAAPRGAKYKWWSDGTFRAPPESTVYGEDEFGEHGYVAPPSDVAFFERFPGFAGEGVGSRTVRVRVPSDFAWERRVGSYATRAVRTLLLHDGQNVFLSGGAFGSWRVDRTLDAEYADVLAVAVDSSVDRFETYTPVVDDIGTGPVGGRGDAYVTFLEDEVLPFVRARYRVRAQGDSLAMAGSSLGGLVTLYTALSRPSLARCAAGLSSTLGWGAFERDGSGTLVRRWTDHGSTALYLDSGGGLSAGTCADGDADGVHEDSIDSDNYCVTLQLRDRLRALGYVEGTDLFHHWEPGAPHSEAAWAARVGRFLSACTTGGWIAE